jgi:phosphoribosylaminoimidazole-succinocarboxamide synthase
MNKQNTKLSRENAIHEGKAKIIYKTTNPSLLIQYFKDDASAFNGKKKGQIEKKGECNNDISSNIFSRMESDGFKTHFVEKLSAREMLVKKVEIIPVEIVVRNIVAGSLAKRMGVEPGMPLSIPVVEHYYKDDDLGDPMINRFHMIAFNLATDDEIDYIEVEALKINEWMVNFFDRIGIILVDYKLEFGRSPDGILLADEISPDGCRFWDKVTKEVLDKDRFRRDMGKLTQTYEEMRHRVLGG